MAYNAINALIDRGPADARHEVSMAKAYCTETAVRWPGSAWRFRARWAWPGRPAPNGSSATRA